MLSEIRRKILTRKLKQHFKKFCDFILKSLIFFQIKIRLNGKKLHQHQKYLVKINRLKLKIHREKFIEIHDKICIKNIAWTIVEKNRL